MKNDVRDDLIRTLEAFNEMRLMDYFENLSFIEKLQLVGPIVVLWFKIQITKREIKKAIKKLNRLNELTNYWEHMMSFMIFAPEESR